MAEEKRYPIDGISDLLPPACEATICFADDHQDNWSTFRCHLAGGHVGPHQMSGEYPFPTVIDMLGGIVEQHWVLKWEDPVQEESK